tara:strand:+ start:1312 stop:1452 length:141 start_codon:yes stop_codon:yes gene_type:complete
VVVKEVVIHPHQHQPFSTEEAVAAVVEMTPLAALEVSKPDHLVLLI